MKADYKITWKMMGIFISLMLTATTVFTNIFTLLPITVYASEPTYVNSYEEFVSAVEDDEVPFINVTSNFSLEGDVTIDRPLMITSASDYTINTNTHSLKIVNGGEVLLEGNLSLTGTSTTIQVLYGGDLEIPEDYYGTISTTGAGGKAIYAVGGVTTRVYIAGGTILADSDARSALSLGDRTTCVTIRGGTISGLGSAYAILMEDGYGAPLNINISESGPDIDDVYVHWIPADAPELEGDYPLLRSLPDPISMFVNEVKELEIDNYLGEWDANYEEGDRVPELNAEFKFMSSNLYLSPETEGVYNLILKIVGTKLTIPVTVSQCFNGGDGSWDNPYEIATAEQLDRVRNFLGAAYKNTYFMLTANIDISSYSNWEPIGDIANPFCGKFYGYEYDDETGTYIYHVISNLTINRNEDYVGLFGYCDSAYIEGVVIMNANVTGGINSDTGALVGLSVGSDSEQTQIVYCSVTGSVTAVGGFAVGGLVGIAADSRIAQSYSTASVTGTSSYAGGLVGYLQSSIVEDSYATGSVTSTGEESFAGGLVGWNNGFVENSYATGSVTSTGEVSYAGGLVGWNNGIIENSYATGSVTATGEESYAGGLVGWNSSYSEIFYCYAAGRVTGDDETGGLIGHSDSSNIYQSYFNIANASSSDGGSKGTGLTTGNMIYRSGYGEDWDFDSVWGIDPWESYPYLRENEQIPHPIPPLATSARIVEESEEPRYNESAKTLTMTYASLGANFMAEGVTPEDGLVLWSSSDTDVVEVYMNSDRNIAIETMGVGTATISLKSSNGNTLDSITVIVEPMSLPIIGSFTVQDKVYDGSENADIISPAALLLDTFGYRHTDEVYANFVAAFSDPNVGENKLVSLSVSTLEGEDAWKYVIDFSSAPTTTATITPKELTIGGSFTAQGKAYDGTTNAVIASNNLTLVGRVGSDDVSLVPVLAFDTPDIAIGKTVYLTADSYLTGTKAGNYTLSIIGATTYTSGIIADREATLSGSFTVENKVYSGDKAATIASNNLTLVGIDPGDDVSIAAATAEFDSAVVGDGKTVRITGVTLEGANAGEYAVSLTGAPTATANITAKPLTITGSFTVLSRQYNGTVNAVIDTNNLTLSGIIGVDIVNLNASAAFNDANAGTGKTVTLTGSTLTDTDASNYVLDLTGAPTTTANITKATGLPAPPAPTLQSKTSTSVTLTPNAEQEFSKDSGDTWQTSNVFTGLTPSTEYSFITRIKDDANHEASPASSALTVTTDTSSDGGGYYPDDTRGITSTGNLEIPSTFVSETSSGKTLMLENDFASVTISSDMLGSIPGIAGKKAEISIDQGDKNGLPDDVKAAIGERPLISLSLLIDGRQTNWSNPNSPVTVNIPYTPTEEELKNPDSIVIWYIDGSGNPQCVTNGHYDPVTGTVTFDVTHFSDYAVVYNPVNFNDVKANAWYYKAVSFIAARDITNGTGNGNYSPEAKLTRADFIVIMMKAYGIAPDTNSTDNFTDAGNTYYTNYLAAAKRLNISAGVGNNMFAPGKEITHQEMFTLLYNALKVIGELPQGDSGKTLSDFSDSNSIADWAKEAVTQLVKTGTISGSAGKLLPQSMATRAEIAQVMYQLMNK